MNKEEYSDELKKVFNLYRNIGMKIIEELQKENYNALKELFDDRQQYVDKLKVMNAHKEDLKDIILQFGILELDFKIKELINLKKNKIIETIRGTKTSYGISITYKKMHRLQNQKDSEIFNIKL